MNKPLTRLAVDNREILEYLDAQGSPASIEAFASELRRDPSNLRKTLKGLEGEGWLDLVKADDRVAPHLSSAGRMALQALAVAEGRLRAGLPPLTHAQISPDPNQPRREFEADALAELAESIAERELQQPILVRLTGPDTAMLVAGERRWRAIGQLIAAQDPRWPADKPIPYHVSSREDEAEILADQIVENLQRARLHPLEEAAAFSQLKDRGWGVGQISKAVSKTRRFVEQRLDLLNLTPELQRKMRLPKDDPAHLTIPRAREILAHLRQIAQGGDEQRDIEEVTATWSAEHEAEARKAKLDAVDMMTLGEVAAAVAARPSTRFPDSPVPVVDVDCEPFLKDRRASALSNPRRSMIELVIDGDAEGRPAGVRMTDLGHVRLRLDKMHPADNPRALFHLRREAGISADQARQLGNLGRYATRWLQSTPPAPVEPAPRAIDRAERFSAEVREAAVASARKEEGDQRIINARLSGTTTADGETWPATASEVLATPWDGYPSAEICLAESDRGRWHVSLSTQAGGPSYSGQGSPPYVYSGDPIFRSRSDAIAFAAERIVARLGETWGRKRKLQAWLASLTAPPAAEAEPGQAQQRILRELAHKLAAGGPEVVEIPGGRAARVGRYWEDLDAVGLWQASKLIEFVNRGDAAGWLARLTAAGEERLAQLQDAGDALIDEQGRYLTPWLQTVAAPPAQPQPLAIAEEEDEEPAGESQLLAEIRAQLAAGAPDFRQLLDAVGWRGEIRVAGDGAIETDAGEDVATIDAHRVQPDDVAQARAELVAFALNQLAAREPALLVIRAGDVVTKGGAMKWRLQEAIAQPGRPAHAFRGQPILHGKDYGRLATISIGDISGVLPRCSAAQPQESE